MADSPKNGRFRRNCQEESATSKSTLLAVLAVVYTFLRNAHFVKLRPAKRLWDQKTFDTLWCLLHSLGSAFLKNFG